MSTGEPEAPENVSIVVANGKPAIPVEVVYVGLDPDGCHHWNAVLPAVYVPDIREGFHISIGRLPGRTVVGLRIAGGGFD